MLKEPPLILLILPLSVFVNRPIRSVIYVTNKLEVPDFLTIIGYIVVKIRYLKRGKEKLWVIKLFKERLFGQII